MNITFLRAFDREGRVALNVPAQLVVAKEVMQDRQVLVERASGPDAPLCVQELFEAFGADRRFQVVEVEVGEIAGQLV